MILRTVTTLFIHLAATAVQAMVLEFPWPTEPLAEQRIAGTSHFLATAPFSDGQLEGVVAEGTLHRQSWRVIGEYTTLQLLASLRKQIMAAGFEILFECETRACGGFDFRYQIDILPEPDMHVHLGDYRYLSAKRAAKGGGDEYVAMIVSRSANAGFVHLTQVSRNGEVARVVATGNPQPFPTTMSDIEEAGERLELTGFIPLDDLEFKTGSSRLGDETFASLAGLAFYLHANPDKIIVLVGHTDAVGSPDSNIELSRLRAAAVLERLVERHGVTRSQVLSDGVGFLAPRASNLTEEGRTLNRRVEAVLVTTQ
ncbi:OmpA family protein [Achromobacter marplatensis]|uniref:OmpA family protein n=1 Tax=Achromobacter marplatensis TaxID=470868 RepID=UPI003D05CD95